MGALRTLTTVLRLQADDAFKGIRAYDLAMKGLDKSVQRVAASIESRAKQMAAALAAMGSAAADVKANMPSGGRGGTKAKAPASDQDRIARDTVSALEREARARGRAATEAERGAEKAAKAADKLSAKEREAAKATAHLGDELNKVATKGEKASFGLKAAAQAVGNLASSAITKGTGLVVAGLEGATQQAVDFESALSDLSRVTKGTDDTEAGFKKIKQGILEASKELGRMPQEVAELTTALAPVFSGKEDLVELTRDVTKIGVAWGVSGKEAGEFFANISRGMGLSADQTKALFGSINQLANELGVKAAVIAEAVQKSAGVIKASGLSEQTGAALNATLIAAGASAEVAATGVRTFVARLESGSAATDKQIHAFEQLGLDALVVGENMSQGGKEAEDQITQVVRALGALPKKDQLPTLIELFGSESIGSIGAAATAVDVLGKSFQIAGDKIAGAGSVQKEFDTAAKNSAFGIDRLKANIGVLAVQMGEKLLPYVNQIVKWLTSKEGQEWGASAVDKAVKVVTTFAEVLGGVAHLVGGLVDTFGGATLAVVAFGGALALALGPWGALAAAAVTAIGLVTTALSDATAQTIELEGRTKRLAETDLFRKAAEGEISGAEGEKTVADLEARVQSRKNALTRSSSHSLSPESIRRHAEEDAKERKALEMDELLLANAKTKLDQDRRRKAETEEKAKTEEAGKASAAEDAASQKISDEVEFEYLSGKKNLTPSQRKRRNELSKSLDKAIPKASSSGGRGEKKEVFPSDSMSEERKRTRFAYFDKHRDDLKPSEEREYAKLSKDLDISKSDSSKPSKMDKQLAGLDPLLAGVLSGEGGGVHDDILSKGVFASASKGHGQFGELSGASATAGPSITNVYNNQSISTAITQYIDATTGGGGADGLKAAASAVASGAGKIVFTGVQELLGLSNGGGVMR